MFTIGSSSEMNELNCNDILCYDDGRAKLGSGKFGIVYCAVHRPLGIVAVKCFSLPISEADKKHIKDMLKENLELIQRVYHNNILHFYGWVVWSNSMALIMEYMHAGNLRDMLLNKRIVMTWVLRLRFCSEIANGISFLHNISEKKPVVHGDLKPSNILLSEKLHCKIAGFGEAKLLELTKPRKASSEQNNIQTELVFSAPEQLSGNCRPAKEQDTYSFALIIYTILARQLPISGFSSTSNYLENVKQGGRPDTKHIEICENSSTAEKQDRDILKCLESAMSRCWLQEPNSRPNMLGIRDELSCLLNQQSQENILRGVSAALSEIRIYRPENQHRSVPLSSFNTLTGTFIQDDFRKELRRLSSFQNFPPSVPIDAQKFAAAGFYFTGHFDEVKCFACSIKLRNLSSRIDPFHVETHRSTCLFVRKVDKCGNEPLCEMTGNVNKPVDSFHASSTDSGLSGKYPPQQTGPAMNSFSSYFEGQSRLQLNGNAIQRTPGSYPGLDISNFQTARPVNTPAPTNDIPIYRQLAAIPNPNQARLIHSLNLFRERHRFQTFGAGWPSDSAPPAEDMAASGWFYLGNLDRTQCFCCGGVLRNWRRLDNPNTEHITHFPHCNMAQGCESRNIPDLDRQRSPVMNTVLNQLTEQQKRDLRIMFPCEFPVTPSMASVRDRLDTFINWHFTRAATGVLAEAGLFSLGVRDRVKCFYCNGGLQNWRQSDDPWVEHAKWYPTCEFLLQQRGPEFVHAIVARFPNINRPRPRAPGLDVAPPALVQRRPEPVLVQTSLLEQAMRSNVAATVIEMGFDKSLVGEMMKKRIDQNRAGYESAEQLLDAVIEAQNLQDGEEHMDSDPTVETNRSYVTNSHFGESPIYQQETLRPMETSADEATSSAAPPAISQQFDIVQTSPSLIPVKGAPINTTQIAADLHIQSQENTPNPGSFLPRRSAVNGNESVKKLEMKLQELEHERVCKVCLDKVSNVVFIPCSHVCCCLECTNALRMCPICRRKIEKAVRIYKS